MTTGFGDEQAMRGGAIRSAVPGRVERPSRLSWVPLAERRAQPDTVPRAERAAPVPGRKSGLAAAPRCAGIAVERVVVARGFA